MPANDKMKHGHSVQLPNDASANASQNSQPFPVFKTDEQLKIVQFVKAVVTAAVCQRDELELPELGALKQRQIAGAFVTLKRNGRLRSCCGLIGAAQNLQNAIQRAANRTATSDPRFPPIAPRELLYLDIDVTLLADFERVDLPPSNRPSGFDIGVHGLKISLGKQSGLLLPVVPVEFGWNKQTFLQQLCRKAGIPLDAWQNKNTELHRFEGISFHGNFDEAEIPSAAPPFPENHSRGLAAVCKQRVVDLLGGQPLAELPVEPIKIFGIALKLSIPGKPELLVANINHRQALDLRSTIIELCRLAAQQIKTARLVSEATQHLGCELILFDQPALHGTLVSPDLRGLDPNRHAIMCVEGDKVGWMFDDSESIHAVTRLASRSANVLSPETTEVVSFEVSSTVGMFGHSTVGKPATTSRVRPMAVAGKFYPIDQKALENLVDTCLDPPAAEKEPASAAMVPHAGLIYSGKVAGDVLKRIELPKDIVILCPKHTRAGLDWAMSPHRAWQIPGASVPANPELAQAIVNQVDHLEFDAAAHKNEHAIEVLLPLIHRLSPESRVTGIAIGKGDSFRCNRFGRQLANVLSTLNPQPLLLISSDMNHFADDQANRKLDELALQALMSGSPKKLLDTVRNNAISMCGVIPACMVMESLIASQRLGTIRKVAYDTSARVSQNFERVVGYAGVIFE